MGTLGQIDGDRVMVGVDTVARQQRAETMELASGESVGMDGQHGGLLVACEGGARASSVTFGASRGVRLGRGPGGAHAKRDLPSLGGGGGASE